MRPKKSTVSQANQSRDMQTSVISVMHTGGTRASDKTLLSGWQTHPKFGTQDAEMETATMTPHP